MNDQLFPCALTSHDRTRAAEIARELLSLPGWTGAQIEQLERVAAMQEDDPDVLDWMEDMRDAREREDALKNPSAR